MTEKITLRLKTSHNAVLPELYLEEDQYCWYANGDKTRFDKRSWEPVPPPYPTEAGWYLDSHGRAFRSTGVRGEMWWGYSEPIYDKSVLAGPFRRLIIEGEES